MELGVGNCDIDFLTLAIAKSKILKFQISFAVNFWKHRKQTSTKYIKTERKQIIIPRTVNKCIPPQFMLESVKN